MSVIACFESSDGAAVIHRFFTPGHHIAGSPHSPTRREPFAEQAIYKVVFVERPAAPPQQRIEVIRCETKAEALDLVADILPGAKEVTA